MGHHKLERFAENLTFPNLFQVSFEMLQEEGFKYRGCWNEFFGNNNPITLELGCGKGDYTVSLARIHPDRNYIGVDIKGARLWRGAKTSNEEKMHNVAFLRTRIELIEQFFAPDEVSEIWITFPDPQPKKEMKRLTCERFLCYYKKFLKAGSPIHLKTDSQELHEYTRHEVIPAGNYRIEYATTDLYATPAAEHPEIPCLAEAQMTQTFYERMFLAQNMPITYIKFYLF
ncbi:MAG: tRNA (guanosine(46)-N7)-methyltransferase TrmB [Bacteroidales bacterium]|nr:tRNA (guanosine(46)-N7)-methyltransferase TrmB [Bacteroidales bacterium]